MQTLLGFDFGLQRIGVAVGQEVTGTATALCTLRARGGKTDWAAISELIQTWHPDALVVGLPMHADGTAADMTQQVKRFARQLEGRYHLPVYTHDERLSSRAAMQLTGPGSEQRQNKGIDAVAAQIILQNWLEENDRVR